MLITGIVLALVSVVAFLPVRQRLAQRWPTAPEAEDADRGRLATPRPRVRRGLREQRLQVWLPDHDDDRAWLQGAFRRIRHEWDQQTGCWIVARPNLRGLVDALAEQFGEAEVCLEFSRRPRCDASCREASGDDCECSCLGANHGADVLWKEWRLMDSTTRDRTDRVEEYLLVGRKRSDSLRP